MQHTRVLVIGGGFSGLAVGVALQRAGFEDFAILEKASQLGGTWRDNTYPGCACDVPSRLYSLSFAPNPDWSRVFAPQPEIQAYLLEVADRFGITARVQCDTEVVRAVWEDGAWTVATNRGEWRAQVLVAGAGPLHEPKIPRFPGGEAFTGKVMHTAQWDPDHDLTGKRVGVVGTGSSAIQLVPEIQPKVAHLTVFQRTAAWVAPKPDLQVPRWARLAQRWVPGLQPASRAAWFYGLELVQWHQRRPERVKRIERICDWHLNRQVADPALRAKLRPDFAFGCKRMLLSNSYFPALTRDNVTLTGAVERLTETGVVDADGTEHPVDTLILATGFHVHDPPIAERLVGAAGKSLAEDWAGSPRAYLGTTVAGFPNLFITLGPNLANGHTSVLTAVEAQSAYLVQALRHMDRRGVGALDVRREVEDAWNDAVQAALAPTVWNAGGCASWYLDATGKNRAIYPWSTIDLKRRLRRFAPEDYAAR